MSWIYLPGQAAEYLEQNTYSDGKQSSTSKKTMVNKTSSKPESKTVTLTTLQSGAMSAASPSETTNAVASSATYAKCVASLWLSQVSLASRLVWPVGCLPKMILATDGLTPFALSAKSDLHGYFWRTFQDCLLAHTGITAQYSETWPRAGMMQNGVCYRRPMWERRTAGKGSGLWRTPTASDGEKGGPNQRDSSGALHLSAQVQWRSPSAHNWKNGSTADERKGHTIGFNDQVLWPTPTAPGSHQVGKIEEWGGSKNPLRQWPTPTFNGNNNRKGLSPKSGDGLATAVHLWLSPGVQGMNTGSNSRRKAQREGFYPSSHPTPSPTDYRTGYRTDTEAGIAQREKRSKPLRDEAAPGGQLNPDWVEWLMGYPIGWTSTKPLPETAVSNWLDSMQSGNWWATDPADVGNVPRTKKDIPNRIARLFATGNGQVPLTAAMAWLLLTEEVL